MVFKRVLVKLYHLPSRSRTTIALWLGAALVGLVAFLLASAANWAFVGFSAMQQKWWWWPLLSLPLGGMAIRWIMEHIGSGAQGSGIPQAQAALQLNHDTEQIERLLSLRIAVAKFIGIVLGLGSGFVLGREGPTVQIGASIMFACRKLLPIDDPVFRRQLILAGGAAGIAAAFNTPLAGIVFAFEELARSVEEKTSGKLLGAVILAGLVSLALQGDYVYFGKIHVPPFSYSILLPLVLIALLAGLIGGAFSWLCVNVSTWMPPKIKDYRQYHPYYFIAACGFLIGICGLIAPIYGSGAEITSEVIAGHTELAWYFLPLKFIGQLGTFLTGLPGGIFAPSLSLGAGIGSWFVPFFDPELKIKLIALGMVAALAAITRAPLTSAIILMEMTDGHDMVISIMISAMIASSVARIYKTNLYHDLAEQVLAGLSKTASAQSSQTEKSK
ncbi:chloride channel protein [Deefgea piscis]|uniref:Chloride channel protein n=1 Tax=Deefgea piscis TaxID=2739061 RepID=A0A6M8SPX1_9NEIS|nr:chloride channel protein [Deefgea piscis]QKJ66208.1 chloride channel protein [Deefgea piscis]